MEYLKFNDGNKMPIIGIGTFKAGEDEVVGALNTAYNLGYRLIDTARGYGNEKGLKTFFAQEHINRSELFVTAKVQIEYFHDVIAECKRALEACGLDYFDLYLIHWPHDDYKVNLDAYQQLEKLHDLGLVKSIGVSNFNIHHLQDILANCRIKPVVNQVEVQPRLPQYPMQNFCNKNDVRLQGYGNFMRGALNEVVELQPLAEKYSTSVNKIVLSWIVQRGIGIIPMSLNEKRQKENLELIHLTDEDLEVFNSIKTGKRYYSCPDNHNYKLNKDYQQLKQARLNKN